MAKKAVTKTTKAAPKKAKARKRRPITVNVSIDYKFTDDELHNHSMQLASEINKKSQLEDELKELAGNKRAEIQAVAGNITKLATWVNTGKDYRNIPVIVKMDYDKGIKTFYHPDDSNRKLGSAKMDAQDYQVKLWSEDGDGKSKSPRKKAAPKAAEEPKK